MATLTAEAKKLRRRKMYLDARMTILRSELKTLEAEQKALVTKGKDSTPKGKNVREGLSKTDRKSLLSQRAYLKYRPSAVRSEFKSLASERKTISGQLRALKPSG